MWSRLAAAVALVGLLRTAWIHTFAEGLAGLAHPEPAIDARFAGVRAALPAGGTVGYVSLATGIDKRGYYQAAYALAPRVVRRGDVGVDWIVAELPEPELARYARAARLELVLRGEGVALLRREAEK